jgi:hypothetical protein
VYSPPSARRCARNSWLAAACVFDRNRRLTNRARRANSHRRSRRRWSRQAPDSS